MPTDLGCLLTPGWRRREHLSWDLVGQLNGAPSNQVNTRMVLPLRGILDRVNPYSGELALIDQVTKIFSDQVHGSKVGFVAWIGLVVSGHKVMRGGGSGRVEGLHLWLKERVLVNLPFHRAFVMEGIASNYNGFLIGIVPGPFHGHLFQVQVLGC